MNIEMPNFLLALPEIFVLGMTCVLLLIDLFLKDQDRYLTYLLSLFTLVIVAVLTLYGYSDERMTTFNGSYVVDAMSHVLKLGVYFAVFVVFVYSKDYLRDRDMFKGEFYVLGLFGMLGMMVMISAHSLLTLYLGLELLSLSLYALVALQRDSSRAAEAAMKYFVLGAIASGMLLYGMSMIYGVTGTLTLDGIASQAASGDKTLLAFGLVFLLVGMAFKLGAVPFHMWVPDVYHGAPTAVTLYIGSAPKIAAFAMLVRLLVDGMIDLHDQWQGILIILAVLSMAIGNIVAIAQTNLKRMLAYSTISHVGFLILGIMTGTQSGFSASMFYALTYVLMALGGFGMIILLSRRGFEADTLDDFKGLNKRSSWYAFMMLILMFSMAGVPPFLGFWAKLAVLQEVVAADMVWLAIVGVVFSVIGVFYYLRIIKLMYFDEPVSEEKLQCSVDMRLTISANALMVLGIGIFPGALMAICTAAFA
ncbi:NADH-ubiquinone oxidoreductase chain N [hydrothermal vent metagenome]|uniref:NADH-ubiquinone oxidoreductase chain N n=1 Tax=hydrothermal vent metagenome TaxID=652676 RepID=A0A3B1B394_9ZZZZ